MKNAVDGNLTDDIVTEFAINIIDKRYAGKVTCTFGLISVEGKLLESVDLL